MIVHLFRAGALTAVIIACMFLPYLPGGYDAFAVTLSAMAQVIGYLGLLLVPVGVLWLIDRKRSHVYAIAALVVALPMAVIMAAAAFVTQGVSFALGLLVLWFYGAVRLWPAVRRLRGVNTGPFNPAPLYLVAVPVTVALVQFSLVGRATEFSREYAIANSAAMVADIERYHQANGRYPASLLALWGDYKPGIIGIERFKYEPQGDAYNLLFEQISNVLGTREIVVYNKRDEHFAISHDSDVLLWTPEQLRARRTFYAVHDAATPHWKYFWFD